MTRSEIACIACSVAACVGMFFAVSESRRSAASLVALEEKFAKLESAPIATPKSTASDAQFARELASLRADVNSLNSRLGSANAAVPPKPPIDPTPVADADLEKKRAEAEARQRRWIEGLTGTIVSGLVEKLALTTQQESSIRAVVEKAVGEYQEGRKTSDPAGTKEAIDAFVKDSNEKIRVLLTPEQQSKYEEVANSPSGIFSLGTMALTPRRPGAIQGPDTPK